ncbi:MAG: SDR family oxidoreductase [Hyphomonadaceae bacterium]|nr:SDR family oxidoreductase [Hyphomonadaceae bacterium]
MKALFDVSGKTALVTGGSSGIGAMIARGFVENGVKTYISARKEGSLGAKAEELSEHGTCIAIPADLSTVEGIEALIAAISERESHLDILVNNAGANWVVPIEEFPEAGWDKVMSINIKSIFFMTQKALPLLRAKASHEDPARVINIASIHGFDNPGMPAYAYSASKSGVIHLTKHLATDLAADHINVNAIAPGFFPSNMTKMATSNDTIYQHTVAQIPRKRAGEPEDIAGTAIYLSSRAGAWTDGHTIVLDGGMIA